MAVFIRLCEIQCSRLDHTAAGLAASRVLLGHSTGPGPLLQAAGYTPLAPGVGCGLLTRGNPRKVISELGGSTPSSLGVEGNGFPVDVVEVIALKVVADIIRCTGACENTGGGDSELEECDVVR